MTSLRTRLFIGLLLACTAPLWAQEARDASAQLAPQEQRITDEALYADHSTYQATQDRIQALNDGGRPVRDYHLAKAQCWLDVSFHEYSRNDRSDFPQDALDQSAQLIGAMEQGAEPSNDTPLVNNARRLREDLWKRLGAIHGTPGFECAQQAVACGEVELVHAGNEFNQQQWRHAKPYIQMAEDLTNEAESLARNCTPEPQNMTLTANLLFDFDRDTMSRVRGESKAVLTKALQRAKDENLRITSIRLIGHADRLQGPTRQYNQALSERRAKAVRDYLITQGIPADIISYEWRGDTEQVQACDGLGGDKLRECLLPNRRVEVSILVEKSAP
ncbi:OmpA family protein [Lysobacter panacisoli]|uniref:OmpA-like domain-containing protein n=1 Tax=Lysobacter panacisoli TaxID=1255263 RepID=A0ABP9L662_9GAMM|nr:OmpA family protein [Lysobacter panacisoli]